MPDEGYMISGASTSFACHHQKPFLPSTLLLPDEVSHKGLKIAIQAPFVLLNYCQEISFL